MLTCHSRSMKIFALVVLAQILIARSGFCQDFKTLALRLAGEPPDDCGLVDEKEPSATHLQAENELFAQVDRAMLKALNTRTGSPVAAAEKTLQELQRIGQQVDRDWPEERQFHYQLLDISPLIVVKLAIRSRAVFLAYGASSSGQKLRWRGVGVQPSWLDDQKGDEKLSVDPLPRGGLAKRARFMVTLREVSCGDNATILNYLGYEWNPSSSVTDVILHRSGSEGQEGMVSERSSPDGDEERVTLPSIGELHLSGPNVTLPYCWHSAVDTYVAPNLCSVDTYDLSGDAVRLVKTETNRPDLEAVAKVMERAAAKDLPAVLEYCGSPELAKTIVNAGIPRNFFSVGDVTVIHRGPDRETVELAGPHVFALEFRNDRWIITDYAE
jgi:hypothetical protein